MNVLAFAGTFNHTDKTAQEIRSLSDSQTALVLHCMKFPQLQSIVYSTCSVHLEENELVVERVMKANNLSG